MTEDITPVAAAIAYLCPYRGKQWVSPGDIMALPPAEFEGFTIRMEGETMLLTRGNETSPTALSLKRLIPMVDKELNLYREQELVTPRDLARLLLRGYVKRGDSLESLYGMRGHSWYGYAVYIGGPYEKGGKRHTVDGRHMVVSEFEGEPCAVIFSMKEIYEELKHGAVQGFAIAQPSLF